MHNLLTKKQGRPCLKRPVTSEELLTLYQSYTREELARHFDVSLSTLNNWIKDARKEIKAKIDDTV
jgi:DNA-directed RNA polymerase specialized sigma24 family protein